MTSVTGSTLGGTTGQTSNSGRTSLNQTFDSFLTLLTTQLRYQDPMSPMDTNEFTSQLVQFSEVEQSIQQNENLESLIALQGANQIAFAASLTGKTVEIVGNALDLTEGESLTFGYALGEDAASTQINIMDENGRTVFSDTGNLKAGDHDFTWDGKDGAGNQLPAGTYRIQVLSKDAEGNSIQTATSVEVDVEGVELADGQIALDVGTFTVSLSNVLAIRDRRTGA